MEIKHANEDNFDSLTNKGLVLVDFFANWCGPCRMMAPIIDELSEKRPDIKFYKVNVDEEEDLAYAFNVQSIPTFVIMRDGKPVKATMGYMPEETLIDQLGL